MCTNILANEKFQELEYFIDTLEDKQGALIEVLHKAQGLFGYLPEEVQRFVAKKLNINVAKVCGVVSFYSYFTTEPRGKYVISICMGTACFVKGAGDVLKEFEKQLNIKAGETTQDSKFTVDVLRCVGACGLAPVVTINDKVYGHFTTDMVSKVLQDYAELEG
ncbi:NADH-quinone oxidoreductase subunit NuoE family protein [Clostridium sp. ZS2-4]|uniref:NADH-quinone oxidoreductase subunit NuoE family protein n=1 Tax=Clostridium sp. ZS2-4 TaxID=2987703 RepID=UPI00227C58F6|nr:NAD(P)H-dependent oxidoreductase subunit E [Clostridium sp. ZS2-4]MCY6353757.1 NAD(P)H-dependent oxidoreductase subunit E [Clostridium sp. ZS2-4]